MVHALSTRYKIDISMFERLINYNRPMIMLNLQHRLNSQFSYLFKFFYDEEIEDHSLVKQRPLVTGVAQSIFFMTHKSKESISTNFSKYNTFEVDYIASFCSYLEKNCISPEKNRINPGG